MSDERAVTVIEPKALEAWGTSEEVKALAKRLGTMLPNAEELTPGEIAAAAQYCRMMDVNPFRGEVYFYKSRGRLCVVDGYKALVRWAQNKARFTMSDLDLPLTDGQIAHVRVTILRNDQREFLATLIKGGATYREALEVAGFYADGAVTKQDLIGKNGPKDPPVGWTWRDVARKRALKNALNLSHGAPSPREMAALSWQAEGRDTIPEDWQGVEDLPPDVRETAAAVAANGREGKEKWEAMTPEEQAERFAHNQAVLHGDDANPFDDPPKPAAATSEPSLAEPKETKTATKGNGQSGDKTPPARIARDAQAAFNQAAAALSADLEHYRGPDGFPNKYHITRAASKEGYTEITNANLAEVMTKLRQRVAQPEPTTEPAA